LSNFLDAAPSVFTPSSAPLPTELGILSAVAEIYRSLYGALLLSAKVRLNGLLRGNFRWLIFADQVQHKLSFRKFAGYSGTNDALFSLSL
jgi:hypothetical protein